MMFTCCSVKIVTLSDLAFIAKYANNSNNLTLALTVSRLGFLVTIENWGGQA